MTLDDAQAEFARLRGENSVLDTEIDRLRARKIFLHEQGDECSLCGSSLTPERKEALSQEMDVAIETLTERQKQVRVIAGQVKQKIHELTSVAD